MTAWFKRRPKNKRGSYVAIREYTYSSVPRPTPKWSRKAKAAFFATISVSFVYFLVSGDLGILRLHATRQYHEDLMAKELALTAQVVDLDTRRRLLETDTLYIEQIARSEFQFSRPGEIIYELTPKDAPKPAAGPKKHSP